MNKYFGFLFLSFLITLSSCNPTVTTSLSRYYAPLEYDQEVLVIHMDQSQPDDAEVLGEVKVGDSGFSSNCAYEVVIDKAKLEARKNGGNALKITEHKPPTAMGSSCHRITATMLRIADIENYQLAQDEEEELLDVDYAILNVYRYSGPGALVGYDLYLGDQVICRVKNNFKTTIHVTKEGLNTLRAQTEVKKELPIDLKVGKTYYIKCGISIGAFVGHPKIELVDSRTGKAEFESFKAKN